MFFAVRQIVTWETSVPQQNQDKDARNGRHNVQNNSSLP